MLFFDEHKICGLRSNLRRSTTLSSLAALSGLISLPLYCNSALANCTNVGNTYTCSGTINSTQAETAVAGNLITNLSGTVNTSSPFTSYKVFDLNGSGFNVTYSGGSNSSIFTTTGTSSAVLSNLFSTIYSQTSGTGVTNITNQAQINVSISDYIGAAITANYMSARGIDTQGYYTNTVNNFNNITATSGALSLTSGNGLSEAFGISATETSPNTRSFTTTVNNNTNSIITASTGNVTLTGAAAAGTYPGVRAWGINAQTNNSGTASRNIEVTNSGSISATTGNATVTNALNNGTLLNQAIGVFAYTHLGNTTLTNSGTITVQSGNTTGNNIISVAGGLFALSDSGIVTASNSGTINVTGGTAQGTSSLPGVSAGIFAAPMPGFAGGDDNSSIDKYFTNSGTITATGNIGYGIQAIGNAGIVQITNTSSGNIQVGGNSGYGIYASTTSNTIDITNNGYVSSLHDAAMGIRNKDTGLKQCVNNVASCTTTINNNGTLIGLGTSIQTATIAIDPTGEGNAARTIINNTGTITTQSGSINDYAIAVGSPLDTRVTVNNTGTITGRIEINQHNAELDNNSEWKTSGNSKFLGGGNKIKNAVGALISAQGDTTFLMDNTSNEITNSGTIRTVGGKLTLDPPNNAVTVYNSGLIDMVNDGSSSVANVVQIDGNFVASSNSAVAVNTQLGGAGSQSDRLLIAGNASGTNTSIIVKDTKGGVGAYNPFGTAIVGYGGTSTGGFTLSADSDHFAFRNGMSTLNKGLYFYYIGQGTGSTGCDAGYTCYSLYSAPSTAAKSLPIAVTAAQSLWQETALMWEDRQVELRDELTTRAYAAGNDQSVSRNNVRYNTALKPQDGGISTWIKSVGAWTNRNNNQTQWGGGGNALSYDLSYRQNSLGMLGGADWSKAGFLTPKDYLVVGVMGGYLNSSVNFNQEAGNVLGQENFTYQGGTVGGSISYMLNGFFADALFKNDMLRSNMKIPVIGLTGSSTGVNTAGGVGNLGYRLNYGSMFFEPMATLTYSNTYMGGLNNLAASGVNVSFGPGNDFRGGFGGRVGSNFGNIISNHMLELSLTGRYWNMFNSNAGRTATIVSDFTPDTIGDYTLGRDYGEIKGNVNVFSLGSGVSAFINTGVRFNDHFQTVITKGGLAYRF